MTTGHKIKLPKSKTLTKDGKIKDRPTGNVSARIRQRKSKKVRPVRKSA